MTQMNAMAGKALAIRRGKGDRRNMGSVYDSLRIAAPEHGVNSEQLHLNFHCDRTSQAAVHTPSKRAL
jgi:hypothetical protein